MVKEKWPQYTPLTLTNICNNVSCSCPLSQKTNTTMYKCYVLLSPVVCFETWTVVYRYLCREVCIIHINIVCSRVRDSSPYGRSDIPLWSSGPSISDSPYQIYPGYQFSSKSDDFKILQGGGGCGPCDVIRNHEEKWTKQCVYCFYCSWRGLAT